MHSTLLYTLLLASALCGASAAASIGTIEGMIITPGSLALPADATVALTRADGTRRTTFLNPNGSFKFFSVADGVYFLDVDAMGYLYPSIKILRKGDTVKANVVDFPGSPDVPYPLRIPPLTKLGYFEPRQGFNIMSWLKTPYGMMLAFMVFSLVIMPMLKVDPEEYQQMLEEKKKLTSAIGGGGGSSNSQRNNKKD